MHQIFADSMLFSFAFLSLKYATEFLFVFTCAGVLLPVHAYIRCLLYLWMPPPKCCNIIEYTCDLFVWRLCKRTCQGARSSKDLHLYDMYPAGSFYAQADDTKLSPMHTMAAQLEGSGDRIQSSNLQRFLPTRPHAQRGQFSNPGSVAASSSYSLPLSNPGSDKHRVLISCIIYVVYWF